MRSDPRNMLYFPNLGPGTLSASHEVCHRHFPEIRGTGQSRSEAVHDLLDRLDRALNDVPDDWHRSLLDSTLDDALEFLAESYDSDFVSARTQDARSTEPLLIVKGDSLYALRFYATEEQWTVTGVSPPALLERFDGLGWVGATLIRNLAGKPPAAPSADRRGGDRRGVIRQVANLLSFDARRGQRRICDRRQSVRCPISRQLSPASRLASPASQMLRMES
jgi:hypothetical protein